LHSQGFDPSPLNSDHDYALTGDFQSFIRFGSIGIYGLDVAMFCANADVAGIPFTELLAWVNARCDRFTQRRMDRPLTIHTRARLQQVSKCVLLCCAGVLPTTMPPHATPSRRALQPSYIHNRFVSEWFLSPEQEKAVIELSVTEKPSKAVFREAERLYDLADDMYLRYLMTVSLIGCLLQLYTPHPSSC